MRVGHCAGAHWESTCHAFQDNHAGRCELVHDETAAATGQSGKGRKRLIVRYRGAREARIGFKGGCEWVHSRSAVAAGQAGQGTSVAFGKRPGGGC